MIDLSESQIARLEAEIDLLREEYCGRLNPLIQTYIVDPMIQDAISKPGATVETLSKIAREISAMLQRVRDAT